MWEIMLCLLLTLKKQNNVRKQMIFITVYVKQKKSYLVKFAFDWNNEL